MTETTKETGATESKVNFLALGVVFIALVIGAGFMLSRSQVQTGKNQSEPSPESNILVISATPLVEAAATNRAEGSARIIQIEAGSFYFKPNEIRLKKGESVKFEIKSADMMHDFNITELNVKIPITKAGNTASVVYTADTSGTFEFYCSVGLHRKNGQVGKLIVE